MQREAHYGTYKLIGHTAGGIEVYKNEITGYVRLQRGQNIIADEYYGFAHIGDVLATIIDHECDDWRTSSELHFEYTLVEDAS